MDIPAADLDEIETRARLATPGPWFVRYLDDRSSMALIAISSVPHSSANCRWPQFEPSEMIAATLVQDPRYVSSFDGRSEQNANFIASARHDIPRLVAALRSRS